MIKVLARPINKAEQFCAQSKGGTFTCEHFTKFFPGQHEVFGFHRTNLIFCRLFRSGTIILYWQNIKLSSLCQNLPWCKTASLRQMQMTRNQPKTFQNRRFFRELNNVTLAEQPPKVIRQTLVLTGSLPVESLNTSFAVVVGLLQSQLALVTISAVRRKFSWGGGFVQGHMVICIWCALFVMSQFDVIVMFSNQRFGKVCWHSTHIFLHPLPLFYVSLHWI